LTISRVDLELQLPQKAFLAPLHHTAQPATMSGRGKGAKGLGKGGFKRHRKVLRDNIQARLPEGT